MCPWECLHIPTVGQEEVIELKRRFSSLDSDLEAVSYTHLTLPTKA